MNGIILSSDNYTYDGGIVDGMAHGKGVFDYVNGDRYVGECKYGKLDGFGTYHYLSGATYTGFFSFGKMHGVGTFEDATNVYKGSWRNDKKHGMFYKTNKNTYSTHLQKWIKGRLISTGVVTYIQPAALQTVKENPLKSRKQYQISYKAIEKKCMACCDKPMNATNVTCGHVSMCYDCLARCDRCPICRAPADRIIKLFVS